MRLLHRLIVDQEQFYRFFIDQPDFLYRFHNGFPYIGRGQIDRSQSCPQFIRNCKAGSQKPVSFRRQVKDPTANFHRIGANLDAVKADAEGCNEVRKVYREGRVLIVLPDGRVLNTVGVEVK